MNEETDKQPIQDNPSVAEVSPDAIDPSDTTEPTPELPSDEPEKPIASQPSKSPKNKKIIAIVLIAVLLGFGVFIIYLFTKDDAGQTTQTSTEVVKKEIPLLRIGGAQGSPYGIYPEGEGYIPDMQLVQQTFEGLVGFEQGTKIVPRLATSWSNPDDNTWVFKLKEGVKFHTGRTMTAEDVKYSLESFKDSYWYANGGLEIKSVKIINDGDIEITTDGPDPILLNKLTVIQIIDSKSKLKNDVRNGTGPYTSEAEIKSPQTAKQIKLIPFDEYHGGRPMVRSIVFKYYSENKEAIEAYKKGEVDILETDTSKDELASILRPDDESVEFSNLVVYYLGFNFNLEGSPIANQKVREAIYLSTDPEALITARKGFGIPAGQVLPIEVPGHNPSITRPARNVAKAKALLKEAGYPKGVTIKLSYYPTSEDAAKEIARQLKEAGITLELDPQGDETYDDVVYGGGAEMFFAGSGTNNLDGSSGFVTEFQDTPNFSDKDVNKLIADAQNTLDQEKRLRILQETSKKLMDDLRWIPLYSPTSTMVVKKSYVISQDIYGSGLGINFWKVYETQ